MVVLSGAGISAESGLLTFRDSGGLWEGHNVYDVATPEAWARDPETVLNFYNQRRRDVARAQPNAAHTGIAALEQNFNVTVITQNIDDLHERGGSTKVLHLHGEIFKMRSDEHNGPGYPINDDITLGDLAPEGGQLRPDIVWFGEEVSRMPEAAELMSYADIFVLIGTSLQVYPAAGLLSYARPQIPKFIIDRKIPDLGGLQNAYLIEKTATEGIHELVERIAEIK